MKGKFIVIEGGDGAGKDTQIDRLKEELGEDNFLFLRDPGGTEIGTTLREIVLQDERITREAELFLYLAARSQMLEELIHPALADGRHVISHRFDLSTVAYQIYGRERLAEREFVKAMSDYAINNLKPDLLIYLDCPPEVAATRMADEKRKLDRMEKESLDFHTRVREGYLDNLSELNHVLVDATQPIEVVHREVLNAVRTVAHT